MAASTSLTPTQRSERARIAANDRWANTDREARLRVTKPGRDAAIQKLLDEVDPKRELPEDERLMLAKNAQQAQMARLRFLASKARRRRAGRDEPEAAAADAPAVIPRD